MATLFERFSAAFGRRDARIAELTAEVATLRELLAAEDEDDAELQEAAARAAAERDAAFAERDRLQVLADEDAAEDAQLLALADAVDPLPASDAPTPEEGGTL